MISKKILITGAGGMLGSHADFGVHTTRATLDVEDLESVRAACKKHKPSVILHLAATTNVVESEKNPQATYQTNAIGSYNVALVAREIGAQVVYVSSSAVFDGKKESPYFEDDVPNPQGHYGHSKYLGELAVSGMAPNYIIVRTCWIFGGGPEKDHKFVASILGQINNPSIEIVGDKYASPTYGKDFISEIFKLIEEEKKGVFHIGNEGTATRADIAREIISITGSSAKIIEINQVSKNISDTYVGGKNESIQSHTVSLRPWKEALREYIETEWRDAIKLT